MNDVEKTNIKRENSDRRKSRRRRKMSVYVLAVILLVITVGITLCFTFMFNINEIVISGESDTYTPMDIVNASGISIGDNLFRIDIEETKKKMHEELLNVEDIEIKKKFPYSISIHVTRCIPTYNIEYQGGVLLVSEKGKILANNPSAIEGLALVQGFEPKTMTAGENISSINEEKDSAFADMLENFVKYNEMGITTIDMTDKSNIKLVYENGVLMKIGNCDDMEYKLESIKLVIDQGVTDSFRGMLRYNGPESGITELSEDAINRMKTRTAKKQTKPAEEQDGQTGQTTTAQQQEPDTQPDDGQGYVPEAEPVYEPEQQAEPEDGNGGDNETPAVTAAPPETELPPETTTWNGW